MSRARRVRRNPSADPAVKVAVRRYSALHDGLAPTRVDHVRIRLPKYLVHLGKETAVEYERRVDDDRDGVENEHEELYRHPFEHHAGSEIFYDDKGQRWLFGGHNKVTERGITDMRHRRSRKLFGFIPRVNPDLSSGQILTRGIGLALVAVGANKAMDTLVDPFLSTDRMRSVVKAGVAGVIGLMIRKSYPFIGAGFVAAGALEVIQLGYREFGMDAYEARARDRVARFAASLRSGSGTSGMGVTSGVYGLDGQRVTGALGAGQARQGIPDPARIRQQMNAAAR